MDRIKSDNYPTKSGVISAINLFYPEVFDSKTFFEPCAGAGALIGEIQESVSADALIKQGELVPAERGNAAAFVFDATSRADWERVGHNDVVITNPPFSLAHAIAPLAFEFADKYLVLVLRLSFLEPCRNRRQFWKDTKDNLVCLAPINPRMKFRSDTSKTDSVTSAVFIWDKTFSWQSHGLRSPYQMWLTT